MVKVRIERWVAAAALMVAASCAHAFALSDYLPFLKSSNPAVSAPAPVAPSASSVQAAADCSGVAQAATDGANREKKRIDDQVRTATKQGLDSAASCLQRLADSVVRMIPGIPSLDHMSADQFAQWLASKACNVVNNATRDAVNGVQDQVNRTVNDPLRNADTSVRTSTGGVVGINGSSPMSVGGSSAASSGSSPSVFDRLSNLLK